MSEIILTEQEVQLFTGYKQQSEQLKWLSENGLICRLGGDGKVKVARDHFYSVMCGSKIKTKKQPNFSIAASDG